MDDELLLLLVVLSNQMSTNFIFMLLNSDAFANNFSKISLCKFVRESHIRVDPENIWLEAYNDLIFYQLFRMQKTTFNHLLNEIIANDDHALIVKRYRGGRYPTQPEKGLLVFLWYISKQDTLLSISDRFGLVPSTVMNLVNAFLYIMIYKLKKKYIFWPRNEEEFNEIINGFVNYPGVVGAVDGSHIPIKVPIDQHDSYADRYLSHSINLMAVCTSHKIFTYIFIGFPGSAHDSRVFVNSQLAIYIERHGPRKFIPRNDLHLIGDSAFPLREWFMTPYRRTANMTRQQKNHNTCLSADRIAIEHTFGILKGRWRRLHFINTYSVSKAIEIVTAACVLHNYCYLNNDEWNEEVIIEENNYEEYEDLNREQRLLGEHKRNRICIYLNRN